jgi:hypothetical protein
MGIINKLIGGLFSFLGSIFKIFNIFKKSEYYLEAPESPSDLPAASAVKAEAPKAQAPAPEAKPAKAAKAAKAATNGKVEQPAATVAAAEPVKVAPATAPAAKPEPVTLFAPNFLGTASSAGRRRPGPSLSPYMDMAKKVKA